VKLTVTAWPAADGSGLSELIVVVESNMAATVPFAEAVVFSTACREPYTSAARASSPTVNAPPVTSTVRSLW
jgi:hypothetical protein